MYGVSYIQASSPLTPVHVAEHMFSSTIEVMSCCCCLLDPNEGGGVGNSIQFSYFVKPNSPTKIAGAPVGRLHVGAAELQGRLMESIVSKH